MTTNGTKSTTMTLSTLQDTDAHKGFLMHRNSKLSSNPQSLRKRSLNLNDGNWPLKFGTTLKHLPPQCSFASLMISECHWEVVVVTERKYRESEMNREKATG